MEKLPYDNLTPNLILTAVERLGFTTTGQLLGLNSYENRVYDIGVEECKRVIVKFYRPKRWRNEGILEEHDFCFALEDREIPVVAPLKINGESLHCIENHRYAVFPAKGGRAPEIDYGKTLEILGHFLGRIHAVGNIKPFQHRPALNQQTYGNDCIKFLLENNWLPPHLEVAYETLTNDILLHINNRYKNCAGINTLRIHADLHGGNILMDEDKPHIVDLDDCRTGPAIQDIWMFLSGETAHMEKQLNTFLKAYNQFYTFDPRELQLIEPLRTLRMLHYSTWLARRWHDPAFPRHFPWFDSDRYWEEHIIQLREQLALLQEPPLSIAI